MIITAPAKINLALDVIGDRQDGYHEVDMVMQSIGLSDRIQLKTGEKIGLTCTNPQVPADRRNLAWRAAELLQEVARERHGKTLGVEIHIEKRIPVAAGLAGGSTDAAGVLIGLNQLWDLGLTTEELMRLGVKLGADVPFCILQRTARAEGIGEKLTVISSRLRCSVLLITPDVQVSTAMVYHSLDTKGIRKHPDIQGVIAALEAGDLERLCAVWGNVLEEVVLEKFPEVAGLKRLMQDFGVHSALMSGSGPSVFALNVDENQAKAVKAALPPTWFCTLTEFQQ